MHLVSNEMPESLKQTLSFVGMLQRAENQVVDPEKPLPVNKLQAFYSKLLFLLGQYSTNYSPQIEKYLEAIWHLESESFAEFSKIYHANRRGIECLAVFYLPSWYSQKDKPEDPAIQPKKQNSPLFLELVKQKDPHSHFAIDLSNQKSFSDINWPAITLFQQQNTFVPIDVINTWIKYIILVGTLYPIVEKDFSEANRRKLCRLVAIDDAVFNAIEPDISVCRMMYYKSPTSPGRAEEFLLDMDPDNHSDLKGYKADLTKRKFAFLYKYRTILKKYSLRAEVIKKYDNALYWRGY